MFALAFKYLAHHPVLAFEIASLELLALLLGLTALFAIVRKRRKSAAGLVQLVAENSRTKGLPTYRQWAVRLSHELSRARRYGHALTVAALQFENETPGSTGEGNGRAVRSNNVLKYSVVSRLVLDSLRESDFAGYDSARNRYLIAFAEAGKEQAFHSIQRLRQLAMQHCALSLRAGLVEFPADGLTTEELICRAQLDCDRADRAIRHAPGKRTNIAAAAD